MKIRSLLLALMFVVACAGMVQAKASLATRYVEALMTNDTETLSTLLAGNYCHISANGHIQDKDHFIANLKQHKLTVNHLKFFNDRVSSYGNTKVITGNAQIKASYASGTSGTAEGLVRFTMVIEKGKQGEKIVLFQLTPVVPSAQCPDGNCQIK